jgi:hypothetical protein
MASEFPNLESARPLPELLPRALMRAERKQLKVLALPSRFQAC